MSLLDSFKNNSNKDAEKPVSVVKLKSKPYKDESAAEPYFEPYKDESTDFVIRYGGDCSFALENYRKYMPPHEQFLNLINDSDIWSDESIIWLQCLLIKHGMMDLEPNVTTGVFGEEFFYPFLCNGVPGLICEDRVWGVESFSIIKDCKDQCENVAQTIRDIILSEGKSVTNADWEEIKRQRKEQEK